MCVVTRHSIGFTVMPNRAEYQHWDNWKNVWCMWSACWRIVHQWRVLLPYIFHSLLIKYQIACLTLCKEALPALKHLAILCAHMEICKCDLNNPPAWDGSRSHLDLQNLTNPPYPLPIDRISQMSVLTSWNTLHWGMGRRWFSPWISWGLQREF